MSQPNRTPIRDTAHRLFRGLVRPLRKVDRVVVPQFPGVAPDQLEPINQGLIELGDRIGRTDVAPDARTVARLEALAQGMSGVVSATAWDPEHDPSDRHKHERHEQRQARGATLAAERDGLVTTISAIEDELAAVPPPGPRPTPSKLVVIGVTGVLTAAFAPTVELFLGDPYAVGWQRWASASLSR